MTATHPHVSDRADRDLAVAPLFGLDGRAIPRHELPRGELPPELAYQIVHDELMLDGNARLNVATFVTTWMEPEAEKLMAECFDKNMIDKDEYPQTAEIETPLREHPRQPLARARPSGRRPGCSTTGSSEAAMLGGLALKRRWQQRRRAAGKPADRPNLVMGINVQVCWEKFANYWDVEMRLVPMEGDRFHLSADEAVKLCDENTIGVVAILGSTFDGSYEPVAEICAALDAFQAATGHRHPRPRRRRVGRVRRPVPRSRARLGLPPPARRIDQRLRAQVRPRLSRASAGSSGATRPRSRGPDLLGQLPRRQHADVRAQLLAPGRAGRRAVLQLPPARLRGLPARCRTTRATSRRGSRREIAELGPFELDHSRTTSCRSSLSS